MQWSAINGTRGMFGMRPILAVAGVAFVFALSKTAYATSYTVNTIDDTSGAHDCSLRDAINAANGNPTSQSTCTIPGSGHDTIQFRITGTITLRSTLPQITDRALTINGPPSPGIAISGNNEVQVMDVASGATLNLNKITVTEGFSSTNDGGGIANAGTVAITNCTFSNNHLISSPNGGAIFNAFDAKLTVTNTTFFENSTGDIGGAIADVEGTVTVNASTFSENSATSAGALFNNGTGSVINSTFSGNTSLEGGGIVNGGLLTITNSTFSGNSASITGGGIFSQPGGSVTVKSTILATSVEGNCSGSIGDAGYNISDDDTCLFTPTGTAHNGDDVNPMLSTAGLANNGGPTQTIALVSESPAIDAIPFTECTDQASPPNRINTDQRGAIRPDAGEFQCDIGAYEFQDFAGQPFCSVENVFALTRRFGNIEVAALVLGFPSANALLNAIQISCGE
jgi:CSLREA domain-containing protein